MSEVPTPHLQWKEDHGFKVILSYNIKLEASLASVRSYIKRRENEREEERPGKVVLNITSLSFRSWLPKGREQGSAVLRVHSGEGWDGGGCPGWSFSQALYSSASSPAYIPPPSGFSVRLGTACPCPLACFSFGGRLEGCGSDHAHTSQCMQECV